MIMHTDVWKDPDYKKGEQISERFDTALRNKQTDSFSPNLKATIGLCAKCINYSYVINDVHQLIMSRCEAFEVALGKHSVKECSCFRERNSMDLDTMFAIAKLIDVDNKEKPGFLNGKVKTS